MLAPYRHPASQAGNLSRRRAVAHGVDVLDPEGERPSTRYICDRRTPTLLDARSFKSFRPGFEKLGAIAAATKPESEVDAAIRSSRAVRNNPPKRRRKALVEV